MLSSGLTSAAAIAARSPAPPPPTRRMSCAEASMALHEPRRDEPCHEKTRAPDILSLKCVEMQMETSSPPDQFQTCCSLWRGVERRFSACYETLFVLLAVEHNHEIRVPEARNI